MLKQYSLIHYKYYDTLLFEIRPINISINKNIRTISTKTIISKFMQRSSKIKINIEFEDEIIVHTLNA